jgi:acyl-CoA synthetase (AMP-forming)/AMP-acid ligase II
MLQHFVGQTADAGSGFYLYNHDELKRKLELLKAQNRQVILWGVSFALLDFVEKHPMQFEGLKVVETGGMKGRRREMIREELHERLKEGFGVKSIYSEYGMTELLSQAYLTESGCFHTPPWMKVTVRDINDPLSHARPGKTGGINVVDLANIDSCAFIATQDLGRMYPDGSFDVLGRLDNSDIRGCNLLL